VGFCSSASKFQSEKRCFCAAAAKAVADIRSLLTDYDIKDRATFDLGALCEVGNPGIEREETDEALQTIGALRALQQKTGSQADDRPF